MRSGGDSVFEHFEVALVLVYLHLLVLGHVTLCHVTH
jgi:hypothetical protein